MKYIKSLQNPQLKSVAALRESKERRKTASFTVEGCREIERAILSGFELISIYMCPEFLNAESNAIINKLENDDSINCEWIELSDLCFNKLVIRENRDGIFAVFKEKFSTLQSFKNKKIAKPLILCIEGLEKPGNLGAILRSADGAGADAVFIFTEQERVDIFHPQTIRASLGTTFSLPIIPLTQKNAHEYFADHNIQVYSAALSDGSKEYYLNDYTEPTAFLLGNEAQGLSKFWLEKCTQKIILPMSGIADSLNVSVAGAVLLYEASKQRFLKK